MTYLFSFITAVIFGLFLDTALIPISLIPTDSIAVRIILMVVGLAIVPAGVSLLFNTYISPEAYELLVKEVSRKFGFETGRTKLVYDLSSLVLSVVLSLVLFKGSLIGIGIGTVISAFANGTLISAYLKMYKKFFEFRDLLPLRKHFE